jgi:hypothetical protein
MGRRIIDDHLAKLEVEFFNNVELHEGCYHGYIGTDAKRPFGNQDVEDDILEIIGATMEGDDGDGPCWSSKQRKYAMELFTALPDHLRNKYGSRARE